MGRKINVLIAVLLLGVCTFIFAKNEKPVVIKIAAGSVGAEVKVTKDQAKMYMEKHPDVKVVVYSLPPSTTDKLAYYLQLFEAKSSDVDICTIDVPWLGDLAGNMLDLKKYGGEKITKEMFPKVAATGFVGDKLAALPCWTDAGMLYYRTDLLEKYKLQVPKTWADLTKTAYIIQEGEKKAGNPDFVGFVWQGEAYGGLTCDALEWIASNDGGTIVSDDKIVTVDNQNAIDAINMAASWVGTISPKGVTSMQEEESRAVFQSGNAAFMRNWPYAYVLAQGKDSKVKGKLGVGPLPAGKSGHSAATLGGWLMAVNKYSKHPEIAADVAKFIVSPEAQKVRAIKAGQNPTLMSLYKDKEVLAANPFYKNFYDVLMDAVARPSTVTAPHFNQVSQTFYKAVYDVLTGNMDAETALKGASKKIAKITGFPLKK